MAQITKTANIQLVPWQDIASVNTVLSPPLNVPNQFTAGFNIMLGRETGTAFGAGWPNVRVEASAKDSGNDAWVPVAQFQMAVGASIVNTTLNADLAAGGVSASLSAGANVAPGDYLLLRDTNTANYELARVKTVNVTLVGFEEPVTYAHPSGQQVTDQAESYWAVVDLSAFTRVRAVVDNASSGQKIAAQVLMTVMNTVG